MRLLHHLATGGLAALVSLCLASCGSPQRLPAVPRELESSATAIGDPGIRSWYDDLCEPFRQELLSAAIRMRESDEGEVGRPLKYLALSGGGSDGAFGAGLLCGWTAAGDRPEFAVVTGVSTGALIAPFAYLGPSYDDELRHFYTTVDTRQIATRRRLISAYLGDGAMDTSPLRALLAEVVDERMMRGIAEEYAKGRLLVVATTNFDADRAVLWNIGAIAAGGRPGALELIRSVLLASASIPAAFPPVMIEVTAGGERYQEMHLDGATKSQVFLYPPSLELRAESDARGVQRERTAFVVRNGRLHSEWESVPRRTLPIARRAIGMLIRANGVGDLFRIYLTARRDGVAFRLAYIPDSFNETPSEEFDPVYMTALFDLGFEMASAPGGYPWDSAPPGWTEREAEFLEGAGATEPR